MTDTLALLLILFMVLLMCMVAFILDLRYSDRFNKRVFKGKTVEHRSESKTNYELYLEKRRVKLEEHSKGIQITKDELDQIIDRLSEVFVDVNPKYRKSISPERLRRYGSETIISSYREALGEGFKIKLVKRKPNPFEFIEITIDEEVDISKMETTTEHSNWCDY